MSLRVALQFTNVMLAGIVAGGMLLVLIAVIPARWRFPAAQAVALHDETSRRIDMFMPASVAGSALAALLAVLLRSDDVSRTSVLLTVVGLAASVVIAVFSLGVLMPINRQVAGWSRTAIPAEYAVVMHRWGRLHAGRTFCAVLALAAYLLAALTA